MKRLALLLLFTMLVSCFSLTSCQMAEADIGWLIDFEEEGGEDEGIFGETQKNGVYTVTFDFGYDGKIYTADSSDYLVTTIDDPAREGYVFLGWSYITEEGAEYSWDFENNRVTSDMTLTAKWIQDPNYDGYIYDWAPTDIIVSLTNHSNSSYLTSGCKRYYAGQDTAAFMEIDTSVRSRNQSSTTFTGVKAKYQYVEDSESKGWGANVNDMVAGVNSGSQSVPDIYCNFACDMVSASVRGCFANLLATDYEAGNHFGFVAPDYESSNGDYFDPESGEGYLYDYMRSLSLTPNYKLYLVASDYTADVLRSFAVMPVNVDLMNSIPVNDFYAGDRDYDDDCDIEDFYDLVWDGEWNYTALASYCNAVFQPGSDISKPETDLSDNIVGLALAKGSEKTALGLTYSYYTGLYSDPMTLDYGFSSNNGSLDGLVTAIGNLLMENESKGICVVDKVEGQEVVPSANTEIEAIRSRFATSNVLFGGITLLGDLEDSVYSAMNRNGQGFGIVPVPTHVSSGEYRTVVNPAAKVMGISAASEKFSQCSAFLDYQSRNSAWFIDQYADTHLTANVGLLSSDLNAKMLTFIRNHTVGNIDKTLDDLVADFECVFNIDSTQMIHGYLMSNGYKVTSLTPYFDAVSSTKSDYLQLVLETWDMLDD